MRSINKLIISTVLSLLISIGLFVFSIRPNLDQVEQLTALTQVKKSQLSELTQQITAYQNSKADLNNIGSKDKILNNVPIREDLKVVIEKIEAAAATTGLTQGLTISEQFDQKGKPVTLSPVIKGTHGIQEVPYSISISGPFDSMLKFLQYMENLPYATEISGLTFTAPTASTRSDGLAEHTGNLTGTIRGVFMVKQAKP